MYEVSTAVRHTHNEDGGIVLDIDHGRMFRLNPVGALIVERLRKGRHEAEIVQEIEEQYKVSGEMAKADVADFLKSLEEHGLVRTWAGEKV